MKDDGIVAVIAITFHSDATFQLETLEDDGTWSRVMVDQASYLRADVPSSGEVRIQLHGRVLGPVVTELLN